MEAAASTVLIDLAQAILGDALTSPPAAVDLAVFVLAKSALPQGCHLDIGEP
jgi:hypothetical protein